MLMHVSFKQPDPALCLSFPLLLASTPDHEIMLPHCRHSCTTLPAAQKQYSQNLAKQPTKPADDPS
jgi:hypothetical protein